MQPEVRLRVTDWTARVVKVAYFSFPLKGRPPYRIPAALFTTGIRLACILDEKYKVVKVALPRVAARPGAAIGEIAPSRPPSTEEDDMPRRPTAADGEILFIAPHSDDVAWSIGELARRLGLSGRATLITVFTTSSYAPGLPGGSDVQTKSRVRRSENEKFARRCALKSIDLERLEGPHRGVMWRDLFRELRVEDTLEISEVAADFHKLPTPRVVLAPLGIGRHVDHLICRAAVQRVFGAGSVVYYEDLPYTTNAAKAEQWARQWLGDTAASLRIPIDDQDVRAEMVDLYASQCPKLDRNRPRIRRYLEKTGSERVWGTRAAIAVLRDILGPR
jgi:2'-N-acetylparomamine deacetylase / 2'''-acetyl-6'''-hydroxyneomycin deacetylase